MTWHVLAFVTSAVVDHALCDSHIRTHIILVQYSTMFSVVGAITYLRIICYVKLKKKGIIEYRCPTLIKYKQILSMPETYSGSLIWGLNMDNGHNKQTFDRVFNLKRLTVYFANTVTCRNLLREEQYNWIIFEDNSNIIPSNYFNAYETRNV